MRIYFLLFTLLLKTAFISAQETEYGASEANRRFYNKEEDATRLRKEDYDFLGADDIPATSGVPMGGIGVGNIQLAPDGRFVRIGLNNIHLPINRSRSSFFALWVNNPGHTKAVRLVKDSICQYRMEGIKQIKYKGLFPRVEMNFGEMALGVKAKMHAYSFLVPHDIKNSSLPLIYFDVEIQAEQEGEVSVAFSFEDFIGKGLKEPLSIRGMDGQIFSYDRRKMTNGELWPERRKTATFAEPYSRSGLTGIRQFAPKAIVPVRANFQNYVDEIAVLVEKQDDLEISVLQAYDTNKGNLSWSCFVQNGSFGNAVPGVQLLSTETGPVTASAIAAKTYLRAGESKTIRFMLVWFYPELKIDRREASPESYWVGGSDYGRYFHNFFERMEQLIGYGEQNRSQNLQKTMEWQQPVLNSTLPDWYKFKLINCGYVIYTNMILNKKGDVAVNEGAMGGMAGTMDQRIAAHPFYQKFFTGLDRSEMMIFADGQQSKGNITHFIGNYYFGIGTVGGRLPTEDGWMIDNTAGWIIQLAKDYEQTGDQAYLRRYLGRVYDGMSFLKTLMPDSLEIPVGPTTYDDFVHPPVYSYGAGIYLAGLKAAKAIADAVGDDEKAQEFESQFRRSQKDMIRSLWNGRFFSYGCERDGTGRVDSVLFTGQLGGQFVSRYCGWGDILPMEMVNAAILSQFKIAVSKAPDYYADKVWDVKRQKGMDHPGSQCWPFYLESYTGYAAFQAGYCDDALSLIRHIQLVHFRKGFSWCQNLWNPGEITYMTAPVSWFAADVLAGAGINIPKKEMRLAPAISAKDTVVILPLYYPRFWGRLFINQNKKEIRLTVTKTFGEEDIGVNKIVCEPAGVPASHRKVIGIPEFTIFKGAVLDLTPFYKDIVTVYKDKAVLKNPEKFDFAEVSVPGKKTP